MSIAALVAREVLRVGANGEAVRAIQLALAARGYPLHGTGFYGDNTKAAVLDFQKKHGLPITGGAGPLTAAELDKPFVPADPVPAFDLPPWLRFAITKIGIAEVPGDADNPIILGWAKACGGSIAKTYKHDATAWCKMFTEYCLISTGFHGIDTLWALDNRKVGTSLTGPAVGSILTKTRDGGGHTGFVIGRDAHGRIVGVCGNQSDRVSRATFDPAELRHNWPAGCPLPKAFGLKLLPIVDSAPLSKREA